MRVLLANVAKMVADTGGLAKVACAFANEMTRRGHEVTLLFSDEREGAFFFPLDPQVKLVNLNRDARGRIAKMPLGAKALREMLRCVSRRAARTVNSRFREKKLLPNLGPVLEQAKPNVIVSFQPAASKLLLCDLRTTVPVITMSHGDPEDYFHTYPVAEIPSLEKSALCQVLMPSFEQKIRNHLPNAKTVTIGNAIPQFDRHADLVSEKPVRKILFVGHLTKNRKRPHLLIEAFSLLALRFPDWIVELWGAKAGEGYFRELERLIASKGLEGRVFLKGPTDDVPSVLREGDVFAFPSAAEGFGMALAEGMSMGLPSIGCRSCPAVNELIRDGETGLLVEDGPDPLSQALERLMADQGLRVRLGTAARADMARFAPERIWDAWEALLVQTAH